MTSLAKAVASALTEPASWASCWACWSASTASTSESARPETFWQIVLMPFDDGALLSSPRYRATAGRIIVEAMSTAQLASMSTILT